MDESMTTAGHDSMVAKTEAEEEAEARLIGALEAAVAADDRPGFGDFYYDPERDGEVDEFAAELELVGLRDPAAKGSEASTGTGGQVLVKVLGTVEIEGWQEIPKRRIVSELACYLALHAARPVSGEELRAALWPDVDSEASAKSLRNYMSDLRRALGSENVPMARGTGYSISVRCDWAEFSALVKSTQLIGVDEVAVLKEALSLVRGRPFTGITYNWAFSELLVSEMEVGVSDAARRLAALSMEAGDPATASFAARQGLLVSPFDVTLWEIALRAAAGVSGNELARTWRNAQAILRDDAAEVAELVRSLEGN
jgi:two-component SAPR family response regulator